MLSLARGLKFFMIHEESWTKMFNLKQPFSRLPIFQRVEMIAPTLLKAILKFCTTNKLFKYFRRRYNDDQLKDLNNAVKIRGEMRTLQLSNVFLKECIAKRVSPQYISSRMKNSQARPSPTMEQAFINDEIGKNREKLVMLLQKHDKMCLKT